MAEKLRFILEAQREPECPGGKTGKERKGTRRERQGKKIKKLSLFTERKPRKGDCDKPSVGTWVHLQRRRDRN